MANLGNYIGAAIFGTLALGTGVYASLKSQPFEWWVRLRHRRRCPSCIAWRYIKRGMR